MDESVINGANLFFAPQFGIEPRGGTDQQNSKNQWILGLVNSAPYVGNLVAASCYVFHAVQLAVLCCTWLLVDRTGKCIAASRTRRSIFDTVSHSSTICSGEKELSLSPHSFLS
jgi:hypothetical protein